MRAILTLMVLGLLAVVPHAAKAGTLTLNNGQAVWQSTKCTEPVQPPSVAALASESHAGMMNDTAAQYHTYVAAMQEYMNCVSNEGQNDATATSDAIVKSAQVVIDQANAKVNALAVRPKSNH
jgi:hypothetical protein